MVSVSALLDLRAIRLGIFVVALLVPLKHSNGFFPFRFLEEALRNPTPTSTVEPTMTTISGTLVVELDPERERSISTISIIKRHKLTANREEKKSEMALKIKMAWNCLFLRV